MQNLVYEWVDFSEFGQIWAKIGSNFRKFWKKLVILFKIWPKIRPIGIWMGYFFLKKWYLYGSTFKFRGGTSLPKPNLSTPRVCVLIYIVYNIYLYCAKCVLSENKYLIERILWLNTAQLDLQNYASILTNNYRLILAAYLLLWVSCDKKMHTRWTHNVLGKQFYKNNARALLLSIFNPGWLQHAHSVRRVNELMFKQSFTTKIMCFCTKK